VAQELMNVPNLTVVTNSPRVADLVHGIDPVAGLTTPNLIEAATNRALIASARRVIVVADHSKWGVIGLSAIATLDQVDVLVTDAELDTEARRIVSEQVGQLIEAQVSDCEADNKPRKVTSS
jgi:DeoR/GlpR family transcriptional regulator of sugar metabolism